MSQTPGEEAPELRATRLWLERVVVGLDLCPFAAAPLRAGRVRLSLSAATAETGLLSDLDNEISQLLRAPVVEVETALLVHPQALADFLDFNDFFELAEALLRERGLEGVIQLVGFHPDYRFEGEAPGDAGAYTNRSPYPMIHLLREASVSVAIYEHGAPEEIPVANARRLQELGAEALRSKLTQCRGLRDEAE